MTEIVELAFNKPARQSSLSPWSVGRTVEEDAARANAGRTDDDFGFHTDCEPFPWWEVDLQGECVVKLVVIQNRKMFAARLRRFSVLVSLDGQAWSTAFRKADGRVFGAEDGDLFEAHLSPGRLARFVRIRLDDHEYLHFMSGQVFGRAADAQERDAGRRLIRAEIARREAILGGGAWDIVLLGGFEVLVDAQRYSEPVIASLRRGDYEARERTIVSEVLRPGDRVLEVGTAVGAVAMAAAAVVGADNVLTFDANPAVVADARRNFALNGFGAIDARHGILKNRTRWRPGEEVDFHVARDLWASRLNADSSDEDIVEVARVRAFCLETELRSHGSNVLICDIEGGEVDLLGEADLAPISLIVLETHYWATGERAASAMMRKLVLEGFDIDLGRSGQHVTMLHRNRAPS